ncbi:site-specific integrase [Streptomyces spongiae]|uniref:Site-specific integrase n=1 Tax=Streptomyces spongiae TaxID=565072 RepID=A0A5N8X8Z3_9ACTN|nr:site-specific integrase [Streptomyces spongiae]
MPDDVLDELFARLGCNRDRAMFSMFLSSGARAAELLGMTVGDAHPGDGRIYVRTKGLGGIKQACPAAPEAFAWLAVYLGELLDAGHRPEPGEPLWWTRRHPLRPLTYTALRAVLTRINDRIGANVSLHDLRHTLGLRLSGDPDVTLVDVQQVMRHRQITTTGGYLRPRTDEVIAKVHEHYARPKPAPQPLRGSRNPWCTSIGRPRVGWRFSECRTSWNRGRNCLAIPVIGWWSLSKTRAGGSGPETPSSPIRKLACRSVDAVDDAEVALDAVGEGHQRLLVCLALVCRDGLFKAVELDQNDALRDSGLVGDDSTATGRDPGQGAPAPSLDSLTGQLVIGSQPLRVGNGGVDTDPVALSHGNLLCSAGHVRLRIDTQIDRSR